MISRLEIRQKSAEWGLRLDVVEKDYVLSWVLWGLFQQPELAKSLAFKGIPFTGRADLWTPDLQMGIAASWEKSLAYQIQDLPRFDDVASEFPVLLRAVLAE